MRAELEHFEQTLTLAQGKTQESAREEREETKGGRNRRGKRGETKVNLNVSSYIHKTWTCPFLWDSPDVQKSIARWKTEVTSSTTQLSVLCISSFPADLWSCHFQKLSSRIKSPDACWKNWHDWDLYQELWLTGSHICYLHDFLQHRMAVLTVC